MDNPVKLWLVMFSAITLVAHASEQLPAQAYGRLPAFFDAAISPDGKHLALGRNDESGEQYLQIINLATGKTVAGVKHRPMAREQDKAVIREVGWADDRRATYLLSATLPTMRMVPDGVMTPGWTHIDLWRTALLDIETDKTYLVKRTEKYDWGLVFSDLRAPIAGDQNSGRMIIRSSPYREGVVNVYRVDLNNGRTRTVTKGNALTRGFLLDSEAKARVRLDVNERVNQWRIFMLDKGEDRLLSSGVSPTGGISVVGLTSFGEIAIIDHPKDRATDVLYSLHPESGALTVLAEHARYDVDGTLVDPWTRVVVGARITEELPTYQYFDVELANVLAVVRKKLPSAYVHLHTWSADRKHFIAFIERPGDAGGYYLYSTPTDDLRLLGLTYSDLKPRDLGVRQEIEYKARDGTAIPAYLTMPDDNMRVKRPLVALVHGGPTARDTLAFDWWASFLASRGYAVIQPNYRGSSGYGRAWQEAGYRQWGSLMQDDVEDAVHALVRAGVADPSRVCIVGASYGGYAALAGGTRDPDLYRCVASIAGVADLPMMLANETVQGGKDSAAVDWWTMVIGNRQDDRAQLEEVSPAYQAANVKAPVLLIHGELDTVVPIKQSERMADALTSAGKAVKFIRLYGEDHWLSDAETRIRMLEELEVFLAEHLR